MSAASANRSILEVEAASLRFQNPVLLAAGTAAYGRELSDVMSLDRLGGLVTKAVSPSPREGAPAPRVAEFSGGMINAVGLANPGVDEVRRTELPWLASNVREAKVVVNVVGDVVEDYAAVVGGLDDASGLHAYELNVSCPNVKAGGMEFGADPSTLAAVVRGARAATSRPIFVKLSPTLADIGTAARIAVDAGADGISVVNTIPGLVIDVETKRPALGFGTGGVSGAGLRPVGVLATWKVRRAVSVPIIGVGGIETGADALQYIMAGASLIAVGTAALRDPRAPERIVGELRAWAERHGVKSLGDVVGTVEMGR
ncbi:MAG TPA: dihydroorotate dehydrogenase [Gemmatimonadaceae bacterium]|nr:dihydroorotate dehydrogenase [Gemmatimonadaceae bacterium]